MPDPQLDSEVVAEAVSHCVGLPEWRLVCDPVSRQRARVLTLLSPEQLRRAQTREAARRMWDQAPASEVKLVKDGRFNSGLSFTSDSRPIDNEEVVPCGTE